MGKRKYTRMQVLLPAIGRMIAAGMSHREIEAELGLEGDHPVHDLLKRQRRTDQTYGHRRVWQWLKDRNIQRNPKTVLGIIKKYG